MERRVPQGHPLRVIWVLSDAAVQRLSRRFAQMYSRVGRPSIAPEKVLHVLGISHSQVPQVAGTKLRERTPVVVNAGEKRASSTVGPTARSEGTIASCDSAKELITLLET